VYIDVIVVVVIVEYALYYYSLVIMHVFWCTCMYMYFMHIRGLIFKKWEKHLELSGTRSLYCMFTSFANCY